MPRIRGPVVAHLEAVLATDRGSETDEPILGETSNHALTHHARRSYWEELMKAGVRAFLCASPYVLHSEFVLVDDEAAVVGSSNIWTSAPSPWTQRST